MNFNVRASFRFLVIGSLATIGISACNQHSPSSSVENASAEQQLSANTELDPFSNVNTLVSLIDFDDQSKQDWINETFSKVDLGAEDENKFLNVSFLSSANYSTVEIKPENPWDLTKFDNYNLAFEVKNNGQDSVHLYLDVVNTSGKHQRRSISLAQGFAGTVYFPLAGKEAETNAGLWGDAPPWKTKDTLMIWRSWRNDKDKFNQIAALKFFTIGILKDKSVSIDDVRIRANPPSDPNWMKNLVDKYGQNAQLKTALTVSSDQELKGLAEQELQELAASTGMADRSRFGGYTAGPKLEATGFFRTAKVDGKWWMVDPDGHLFFSHGPANVRMANMTTITGVDFDYPAIRTRSSDELTPEDSMGIVKIPDEARKHKYIISELRHGMFEWLPEYDDPLADHYSYRRSTHKGPVPHGETYSFYRANLERRYGEAEPESYVKKWHQVTIDRMHDWGFTSFGNWVDPAFYELKQVPYFANGWIIGDFKTLSGYKNHWGLMPDAFDPVFKERAVATISAVAEKVKASPWCAGIFIDNEKSWGEREGSVERRYGVILDALSKNASESPAKNAFSDAIKTKYDTIEKLNAAWQTSIKDWTTFESGVNFEEFNQTLVTDLSKLLEMLGEQYFNVVHNTLEEYLPNHLYMGARMANWGMPDEIIKASLKYSDVLSFNIYEEGVQEHFWKFLEEVDLPVTIGEFHIGTSSDSGLWNPGIVHAANQKDRAKMYKEYMQSVLSKPYMVGAHWFQYIDEPISGRAFDGENANIGFVTVTDIPYPELVSAVKEVTSTMYQDRLKN